LIISPLKNL